MAKAVAADLAIAELARIVRRGLRIGRARCSMSISCSSARRKAARLPALSWIFQTWRMSGRKCRRFGSLDAPPGSAVRDLTAHQDRARLGSGHARPVRFKAQLMGRLVLATDGLFKYLRAGELALARLAAGCAH